MKRLSIPAVLAVVTFAVPTVPLAAQQSPDQLFTSYLAAAGSIAASAALPSSPTGALVRVDRESDDGSVPGPAMASTDHTRLYLLGGAALTAGTIVALQRGQGGPMALSSSTPAPAATIPSTTPGFNSLPGLSPPVLASSPTVTVNPEPATVLLTVTGLLGIGAVARRRRGAA